METRKLYYIKDGYYYQPRNIVVPITHGIPSNYTDKSPEHLEPNHDEWIRATNDPDNFWALSTIMPPWDTEAYNKRLQNAQAEAINRAEVLFDAVIAKGLLYDFGQKGIDAKNSDPRTNGGTQGFEFTINPPWGAITWQVAHDDGFLHVQSRKRDRGNLFEAMAFVKEIEARATVDNPAQPVPFQMTENVMIPLTYSEYKELFFQVGNWYSVKFYELQLQKGSIRALTKIEDALNYTPFFSS